MVTTASQLLLPGMRQGRGSGPLIQARLTQADLDDFNARLNEGMREYVARRNAIVLPDTRPKCPNCHGICSPGARTKVRGVWWCRPCSVALATSLKNHSTGTAQRIDRLKAEQGRAPAPPSDADGERPDTPEDAAERAAIVQFLRAATALPTRESNEYSWGQYSDARARIERIADGIERDRLPPDAALARIREIARATSEPLATRLFTLVKGIDRGKHRAKAFVEQHHEAAADRGVRARLERALAHAQGAEVGGGSTASGSGTRERLMRALGRIV